ncbi:MAG: hypothetical protein Q7K42_03155, partial [Candidatus Diapherotrites archaeon]|nr:hypothetical protein [Candidatus Diapherotrites archaeon]
DLVWHYLAYGKEIRSSRTELQLDKLKKHIVSTINSIDSATAAGQFPPIVSALCNWCEFRDICPAQKHLVKTGKLSPVEFKQDSGVQLVDKYVSLDRKKKELIAELEPELEALKAKIIEFAKSQGAEIIAGSEFQARVKTYVNEKFPSTAEVEGQELEKLLKELGLYEHVAGIDTKKLTELLPHLQKEAREKLSAFLEKSERTYVYLGKKKQYN